jgi:hypothetical protein
MSKKHKPPKKWNNNKPEEIFIQAEVFSIASDYTHKASLKQFLNGSPNFGIQVSFAANVNHAFACELYLKCLQVIEQGFYFEGHRLLDLFNALNPQTQAKIIKRHDVDVIHGPIAFMINRGRPKTILELLAEANNAFVEIRYCFENDKHVPYDLSWAARIIRNLILELRPEFNELISSTK